MGSGIAELAGFLLEVSQLMMFISAGNSMETLALRTKIVQLERMLMLSVDALQTVVERLEIKLGADFFGDGKKINSSATSDESVQQFIQQIDESLKQGQQGPAVKAYREEFHLTWDEALAGIQDWKSLSGARKVQLVRLFRWLNSVSNAVKQ